jgi:hypothetical protein
MASTIHPGLTVPPLVLRYNTLALANSAPNPFAGESIIEDCLDCLLSASLNLFEANRT